MISANIVILCVFLKRNWLHEQKKTKLNKITEVYNEQRYIHKERFYKNDP